MTNDARPDPADVYARARQVLETAQHRGQFAPAEAATHIEALAAAVMDLAVLAGARPAP